ncbi:MAG TPA: sigma factor-like helix-turn-helix DNA-binding protein [Polyangiaceae bacterium]
MTFDSETAASLCLLALAVLGAWDGIVVHVVQEKLPCREHSRLEHGIHTVRALLFPLILATFFISRTTLAVGLVLIALDQIAEVWDMAIERQSRAHSGGLRSFEYVLHGAMITLRAAGVAFALSARSSPSAEILIPVAPLASWLLPGSVLVAVFHVALLLAPVCRDRFAIRRTRAAAKNETLAAEPFDREPERHEGDELLAPFMNHFVDQLPSPYQEAIRLTELQGLSMSQAAERERVSLSAMKSRAQRGRRLLRGLFEACCEIALDARGRVIEVAPR